MSEMVERVASAMKEAVFDRLIEQDINLGTITLDDMARAAIAAMREPTETMLSAGVCASAETRTTIEIVWKDMLDAALETKPAP